MSINQIELLARAEGRPVVTLRKERATWYWFVTNPQGGGFGSNHCGAQRVALAAALRPYPDGFAYRLVVNDKDRGVQMKGRDIR